MFGRSITLFRLFGFHVQADVSWLLLAFLITWSLATGYFPFAYEHLSASQYWWMAVAGAIGLFASLIFHELAHSVVARRFGIPIKGITLFLFGGVARMEDEPGGPKAEFAMAIAGPVVSVLLAVAFYAVMQIADAFGWPGAWAAITGYLSFINVVLAIFNMIPAFPLDGGRVLRAGLWAWRGDIRWATRVAAGFGSGFGIVLMVWGGYNVLTGRFGGLWYVLIGFFLYNAAGHAYSQLLVRRALENEPVRRFMSRDPVTVSPELSVQTLVDDYLYRYLHDLFPVLQNDRVVGCISTKQLGGVPREEWSRRTVRDVMTSCGSDQTVQAESDAVAALAKMNRNGSSRLLVMDGERLVGILVLKDLLRLVAFRMDLEGQAEAA